MPASSTSVSISAASSAITALSVDTGTVSLAGGLSVSSGVNILDTGLVLSAMTTPAAPGASKSRIYAKSDGNLYFQSGTSATEKRIADTVGLSASAFTDTTVATNITSGTISAARLPGVIPTLTVTNLIANLSQEYSSFTKTGTQTLRIRVGTALTTETGANAGSEFYISTYADDGSTLIATPFRIKRGGQVLVGTWTSDLSAGGYALNMRTTASNDGLFLTDSTRFMLALPGTTGTGSFNNLVSANDNAIIFSAGSAGTGNFVLAPWFNGTGGMRMNNTGEVGFSGNPVSGYQLDVSGVAGITGKLSIAPSGTGKDNAYNGALVITKPTASGQYINLIRSGNTVWSIGYAYNTNNFAIGGGNATDSSFTAPGFQITTGNLFSMGAGTPVGSTLSIGGNGITLTPTYGALLSNSYYDTSWKFAGNGYAWGFGNNFGGTTYGVTLGISTVNNASGAAATLFWNPYFNFHATGALAVGTTVNYGVITAFGQSGSTTSGWFGNGNAGSYANISVSSNDRLMDFGIRSSTYSGGEAAYIYLSSTTTPFSIYTSASEQIRIPPTGGLQINNSKGLTFLTHASETAARANFTDIIYALYTGSDSFRLQVGNRSLGWNGTTSTAMSADNGYLEIATGDSATEPIYVSQYTYVAPYTTGTASQSGNTITGSGTGWTVSNAPVGSEFVFTGSIPPVRGGTIKAVVSTTQLTVDVNQTVASATYTIGPNSGFFGALNRRASLLDESGYTSFPLRLGIGTTPTIPLDIVTNDNVTYTNVMTGLASALSVGNTAYFGIGKANSTNNSVAWGFYNAGSGSTSNRSDLTFWGGSPLLSVLASGNVGIGITAPAAKLDVAGTLRLNGTTAGTNWTQLQSAATPTANVTYTLPSGAPASTGYFLTSTTGGAMSWANSLTDITATNGNITTLTATTLNATTVNISGNLTVLGTFTTYNSVVTTIENPTIDIGGGLGGIAPSIDDGYDRGITFQWHNGTSAKKGFFGFDRSASAFLFVPDATITSGVVSGTGLSLSATSVSAPTVIFTDQSSSPSAPGSGLTTLYSKSGSIYYRSGSAGSETSVASTGKAIAMAMVFG